MACDGADGEEGGGQQKQQSRSHSLRDPPQVRARLSQHAALRAGGQAIGAAADGVGASFEFEQQQASATRAHIEQSGDLLVVDRALPPVPHRPSQADGNPTEQCR